MTNGSSTSPIGAASEMEWLTVTNLVVIAIGIVLALLVIGWGARLKRQRKAAEHEIADRADAAPPTEDRQVAPVAPPPPPLAGDDTPVVAAAPFDAAPATIAADLATPPTDGGGGGADDLTRLKGVGPKLAARLGELGITRFADIAALSPEQAAALDAQLGSFQGRMARDRWIEQAGYLARDDRAGFEAAFGRL